MWLYNSSTSNRPLSIASVTCELNRSVPPKKVTVLCYDSERAFTVGSIGDLRERALDRSDRGSRSAIDTRSRLIVRLIIGY